MRIIPKNTKVSTEFFKGVTLADMVVGFIGVLIVFLLAISSLPYRGYIAFGFASFVFISVDMKFLRILLFSLFRAYYTDKQQEKQAKRKTFIYKKG